jgi:hypothetical protein
VRFRLNHRMDVASPSLSQTISLRETSSTLIESETISDNASSVQISHVSTSGLSNPAGSESDPEPLFSPSLGDVLYSDPIWNHAECSQRTPLHQSQYSMEELYVFPRIMLDAVSDWVTENRDVVRPRRFQILAV